MPGSPPLLQTIGERDHHHQREERQREQQHEQGDRHVEERDRGRRLAVVRDEIQEPGKRGERRSIGAGSPDQRFHTKYHAAASSSTKGSGVSTTEVRRRGHAATEGVSSVGRRGRCTASSRTRTAEEREHGHPYRVRQLTARLPPARGRARATVQRWRPAVAARRQSPRPLEAARAARPPRGATSAASAGPSRPTSLACWRQRGRPHPSGWSDERADPVRLGGRPRRIAASWPRGRS